MFTLSKIWWLLDDGPQDPGVGEHHDDERDEVDGDQEEQSEGGDGARVRTEGHTLLGMWMVRLWPGVPHESLEVRK